MSVKFLTKIPFKEKNIPCGCKRDAPPLFQKKFFFFPSNSIVVHFDEISFELKTNEAFFNCGVLFALFSCDSYEAKKNEMKVTLVGSSQNKIFLLVPAVACIAF